MITSIEQFRLPFNGRWFVAHAGDTHNVNHHMQARAQWYGIDFLKVGGESKRALMKSDGKRVEDYYSWEETVLAPMSGIVESALDGLPDNPIGVLDKQNAPGNYVVIQTEANRFVFIAHFQKGSICVRRGDFVTAGRLIGRCGNSGNSTAPHIHLHTQDTLILNKGQGQNMIFGDINVELTGKIFENVDWPLIRGLFVWDSNS